MDLAPIYSIVIPAYNESERIGPTLDRVLAYVRERKWNAEILVVNDGLSWVNANGRHLRSYEIAGML